MEAGAEVVRWNGLPEVAGISTERAASVESEVVSGVVGVLVIDAFSG